MSAGQFFFLFGKNFVGDGIGLVALGDAGQLVGALAFGCLQASLAKRDFVCGQDGRSFGGLDGFVEIAIAFEFGDLLGFIG